VRLKVSYLTNKGKLRHRNEDALLVVNRVVSGTSMDYPSEEEIESEKPLMFAVADGMGGLPCGDLASRLTLEYIKDREVTEPQSAERVLREAKEFLDRYAEKEERCRGMGTAIAGISVVNGKGIVFNTGDCRVYMLRDSIYRLTRDHTEAFKLFEIGVIEEEDIRNHPLRNILTSALIGGYPDEPEVYSTTVEVGERDTFLICSDGLWDELSDREIKECLLKGKESSLCLFSKAYRVGKDNISFIILRVL